MNWQPETGILMFVAGVVGFLVGVMVAEHQTNKLHIYGKDFHPLVEKARDLAGWVAVHTAQEDVATSLRLLKELYWNGDRSEALYRAFLYYLRRAERIREKKLGG